MILGKLDNKNKTKYSWLRNGNKIDTLKLKIININIYNKNINY